MYEAMRHPVRVLTLLLLLVLPRAMTLQAEEIEPGIDVWKTPQNLETTAEIWIREDFFGAGSDAYPEASLSLHGEPLVTAQGAPSLAQGDTVIERLETAVLAGCGAEDTVPIVIRALSLKSAEPFTVTYGGLYSELWDVRVYLSASQANGELTIRDGGCSGGGTFSSTLPVRPKFVFTRLRDGDVKVLDPGEAGEIVFEGDGDWVYEADEGVDVFEIEPGAVIDGNGDGSFDTTLPGTSNFHVGVGIDEDGDQVLTPVDERALLDRHGVGQSGLCDDSRSFDRLDDDGPAGGVPPDGFKWRRFAAMIALALVGALIPLRRPPSGS